MNVIQGNQNRILTYALLNSVYDDFIKSGNKNAVFLNENQQKTNLLIIFSIFNHLILLKNSEKKIVIVMNTQKTCENLLNFLFVNFLEIQKFKKEYSNIHLDQISIEVISNRTNEQPLNSNIIIFDYKYYESLHENLPFENISLLMLECCNNVLNSCCYFDAKKIYFSLKSQIKNESYTFIGFISYPNLMYENRKNIQQENFGQIICESLLTKFENSKLICDQYTCIQNDKHLLLKIFMDDKLINYFGENVYHDYESLYIYDNFKEVSGISKYLYSFCSDVQSKIIDKIELFTNFYKVQVQEIELALKKYSLRILIEIGHVAFSYFIQKMLSFINILLSEIKIEKNEIDYQGISLLKKMFNSLLNFLIIKHDIRNKIEENSSIKFSKLIAHLKSSIESRKQIVILVDKKLIANLMFIIFKTMFEKDFIVVCEQKNFENNNLMEIEEMSNTNINSFLKFETFSDYKILIYPKDDNKTLISVVEICTSLIDNNYLSDSNDILFLFNEQQLDFQNYLCIKNLQSYKLMETYLITPEPIMNNYEKIINEYQKMYESLKSDLINQSSEKKECEGNENKIEKLIIEKKSLLLKENENFEIIKKINKLEKLKIIKNNVSNYFFYTNEAFFPDFSLNKSEKLEYLLYAIELYDEKNNVFMENKLQLGIIIFGEKIKKELLKSHEFIDTSSKIKLSLKYLTKFQEIPQKIHKIIKITDAFLWSAINDDDLYFFQIYANNKLDSRGFFKNYVKTTSTNTQFLPLKFNFDKDYMTICLLNRKTAKFDVEKYEEIEKYIEELKDYYLYYNNLKKGLLDKKIMNKMNVDSRFLNMFKENPDKNSKLIIQNITNFRKHQIKNYQKILTEKLVNFKIQKKAKTLNDRKMELESHFLYQIQEDDYLLKVLALTHCIEDYIKIKVLNGKPKYTFTDEELSKNLCFISEYVVFPFDFNFMTQLFFLKNSFIQLIRDFIIAIKFKEKILKIMRKTKINVFDNENSFLEDDDLDYERNLKLDYSYCINEHFILKNIQTIEKLLNNNNFLINEKTILIKPDSFLKSKSFGNINLENIKINCNLLRKAITARKYDLEQNYERMEFLGDAIIKLLTSIQVFFENPEHMEGKLTSERIPLINNNFFTVTSIIFHLFKYFLFEKFRFIPPCYQLQDNNVIHDYHEPFLEQIIPCNFRSLPNKSLADLIESITAIIYLSNNKQLHCCQSFLYSIDILKKKSFSLKIYKNSIKLNSYDSFNCHFMLKKFKNLQNKINYSFKNPSLLIQAFTHISFRDVIHDTISQISSLNEYNHLLEDLKNIKIHEFSYERLEFLGDAVLDFYICENLFNENENENPGRLTTMKVSLVNNKTLALISLIYDFDEIVFLKKNYLNEDLINIKAKAKDYLENPKLFKNIDNESFKMLGDLFESFIGALFVDSEFDLAKISYILKEMIYDKLFKLLKSKDNEENNNNKI